jgi:hypothetical protein
MTSLERLAERRVPFQTTENFIIYHAVVEKILARGTSGIFTSVCLFLKCISPNIGHFESPINENGLRRLYYLDVLEILFIKTSLETDSRHLVKSTDKYR